MGDAGQYRRTKRRGHTVGQAVSEKTQEGVASKEIEVMALLEVKCSCF